MFVLSHAVMTEIIAKFDLLITINHEKKLTTINFTITCL